MPFNLNSFKSSGLIGGGARPALFAVRMTNPPTTGGTLNGAANFIEFLCQAASLPSSTMDLVEVPYFGRRVKIAGERIFRDWTVTVMCDENFAVRDLFENWSNMINSMLTNLQLTSTSGGTTGSTISGGTTNLLGYKLDGAEVLQYSKIGPSSDTGVLRAYQFFGMFPIDVGTIQLDWSRGNAIETFDVTFAYDYWLPASTTSGGTHGSTIISYTGDEGDTTGTGTSP